MPKDDKTTKNRRHHNNDIIRRFKAGDVLMGKSMETWYPPRPIIKKDFSEMARLYNREHDWDESGKCKKCGVAKVLWESSGMMCRSSED